MALYRIQYAMYFTTWTRRSLELHNKSTVIANLCASIYRIRTAHPSNASKPLGGSSAWYVFSLFLKPGLLIVILQSSARMSPAL